jgi:glycosyltransferase involved in cell wall biosynthesis
MVIADFRRIGIFESEQNGVHFIETPDLLWGRLRSGWDIWNTINRIFYLSQDFGKYDILHCFETRPATIYPALFYRNRNKLPLVTDWNDWWGRGGLIDVNRPKWYRFIFGDIETYYEENFRNTGNGLTVISTALAERAVKLGVPKKSICYIPGGTIPSEMKLRTKEECRKRVGFSSSDSIIGYCGMGAYLDIEIVMESIAILAKKYPLIKLIITGNISEKVLKLARQYQIEDNIFPTGFLPRNELPWYLGCSDVFVLPFANKIYNVGRWPNKIGIYMCLGRPTVSNPVGDIKTLFEQEKVGLLADWDPTDFALKITYLIDNPDVAVLLGKNAAEVAIKKFNWQILTNRLEKFYFQILNIESNS